MEDSDLKDIRISSRDMWVERSRGKRMCHECKKDIPKDTVCLIELETNMFGKRTHSICQDCSDAAVERKSKRARGDLEALGKMSMALLLQKHGASCNTCRNNPTNHGQRESCIWDNECLKDDKYSHYDPLPLNHKFPKYCC